MNSWTAERIAQLTAQDIKQLRENAQRLNETEVAVLCTEALARVSPGAPLRAGCKSTTRARRLVARGKAFAAHGVLLRDQRSWGGARSTDGAVFMALWAEAIESAQGACRYLLWAPNLNGSRPWSDAPAGQERLKHCREAMQRGGAHGLLVYGERLTGHLPEERAYAVRGVDAETMVAFQVEMKGSEFWATWGRKAKDAERA